MIPVPLAPVTQTQRTKDLKGLATVKLIIEDGPLNHIKKAKSLREAWLALKSLYDKEGFSSIFILIKRFISTSCKKDKVDEFLNQVRSYINDLESKGVKLPSAFVNAWVLEKLDKSYSDFKTTVYANFRSDEKAYTLESLSSSILDEYRRRREQGDSSKEEKVHFTSKKPWKKKKGKFCKYCEKPGHAAAEYWILYPNLKPNTKGKKVEKKKKDVKFSSHSDNSDFFRDKREKALLTAVAAIGVENS